jgi:molybdenum cofactor cytidylyltransferase
MNISAIVLAAGQSKRMGQPKLLLPWENTTVLGKVIETLNQAGIEDILVVTGGAKNEVEIIAARYKARVIYNVEFEKAEMLVSIQLGLKEQNAQVEGTLICLGDQPQVEERCVRKVYGAFQKNKCNLVVPSYQMHRGHPWLVSRELWGEVLEMRASESMRDFLSKHQEQIFYVEHDSPSVLQDLDTPEDYLKFKP